MLRQDSRPWPGGAQAQAAIGDVRGEGGGSEIILPIVDCAKLSGNASAAKLLQSEQHFGMLLKVGDNYVMIKGTTLSPLQAVERCTAEVLQEAQAQLSAVTAQADHFEQKTRIATVDKFSGNTKAERAIAQARGADWRTLHFFCEVHVTSTIHGQTFHNLELGLDVSSMVHCALSLRVGAAMNRFRACMRLEVASKLHILRGRPPQEATQRRDQLLKLFLSRGPNLAFRKIVLAMLPNGDWSRRDRVEYYIVPGAGGPTERPAICRLLCSGLISALCSSPPSLYPRHRWTGADVAVDDLGLLEAIHGLLSSTYRRFYATFAQPRAAARAQRAPQAREEVPAEAQPAPLPIAGVEPRPRANQEAVAEGLPGAGANAEGEGDAAAAEQDAGAAGPSAAALAALNEKHRTTAMQWVNSDPLGRMMLFRRAMEPLRALLHAQLWLAGEEWEREEQLKLAVALAQGGAGQPRREYRVTIAADGKLENKFFEALRAVPEDAGFWATLPMKDKTVSFRSLAFRILTRAGAAVHQLLVEPRQRFPIRLFRLVHSPEMAEELSQAPACLRDGWTEWMLESHPGEQLTSSDFRTRLLLAASMAHMDIAGIEARHASIRRVLKGRSVQTHMINFEDADAAWVCQRVRQSMAKQSGARGARNLGRFKASAARDTNDPQDKATIGYPRCALTLVAVGQLVCCRGRE